MKLQVKRGIFTKKRVKQSEFDYFGRIKSVLVKSKNLSKSLGARALFSALSVDNGAGRPKLSIMKFEKIDPKSLNENSAKLIGSDWLLICAGTPEKYNMMTASWGAFGFMWNAPSIFVFVRPTRYTYRFMEESKGFTINVLPESRREALRVCGSVSGRDCDKTALSGLTPAPAENGGVFFEEARLVFECRKAYSQMMDARSFEDKGFLEKWYADSNFHKMYVGIIESAYKSV